MSQMHMDVSPYLPKSLLFPLWEERIVTLAFIFYSLLEAMMCKNSSLDHLLTSAMRQYDFCNRQKRCSGFVPCSLNPPQVFWEAMCSVAYTDGSNPFYPYVVRLQHETVYCPRNLFHPVSSGWRSSAQCKITLTYADINEITHAIFTVSLKAYPGVPVSNSVDSLWRHLT